MFGLSGASDALWGKGLFGGPAMLGGMMGGLFGDSGSPYEDAMKQYEKYFNQAKEYQQPFWEAGKGALPEYQNWLKGMSDPTKFINNIMGQYQESPYAKYQQQQSIRSGQNAASASGLMGSSPFAQQLQQNAQNISSQDQNQWLKNVLGVNTQYGQGQQNLISGGQNAANQIANMLSQLGGNMAGMSYGAGAARNNDMMNNLMMMAQLAGMFA